MLAGEGEEGTANLLSVLEVMQVNLRSSKTQLQANRGGVGSLSGVTLSS